MTEERQTDANGNPVYRIPDGNLEGLKQRVQKLNRRAAKLGTQPLVLTVTGEAFETRQKLDEEESEYLGRPVYIEFQVRFDLVTVTGESPRVNGWTFAAAIEHSEDGNILRVAPGFDTTLPLEYRTATTGCDHCHTKRQRNDTCILKADGRDEWKQVGRNCLADFLRCADPTGLAEWAEIIAGIDDIAGSFEGGSGSGGPLASLTPYLALVRACVRQDGWCSRTEARNACKQSTADQAWDTMFPRALMPSREREALRARRESVSDADRELAAAAIAWAQELPQDCNNDYLWNIRVISHREAVDQRAAGLAASIITAHARHLERELARKYEREHSLNEHFGTPGDRVELSLTVLSAREMESQFGVTTLVLFRDSDGRKAKWFASGSKSDEFEIGATVIVRATIKGHDEYKGWRQTTLTRVSIYDAVAEAKAKADNKAARKAIAKFAKAHGVVKQGGYNTCGHELNWNTDAGLFDVPEVVALGRTGWGYGIRCCKDCLPKWQAETSTATACTTC